jgi:hypothetical protein
MRNMFWCLVICVSSVAAGAIEQSGSVLEIMGLFSLETYADNAYARFDAELAVNPTYFLNVAVSGSVSYRNYSLTQTSGLSCALRLPFRPVVLSIGPVVGLKSTIVGNYQNTDLVLGVRAGVSVPLSKMVAICLRHEFAWVYSEHIAIATSTMVGVSFSIISRKEH